MALLDMHEYEEIVQAAVDRKIITWKDWTEKWQYYHDEHGHSFVHYLTMLMLKQDKKDKTEKFMFITENQLMISIRDDLKKEFGVEIITMKEFIATKGDINGK